MDFDNGIIGSRKPRYWRAQISAGKQGPAAGVRRAAARDSRRRHQRRPIHSQSIPCPARPGPLPNVSDELGPCSGSIKLATLTSSFRPDVIGQRRPKEANDQMVKETARPQRHAPPVTFNQSDGDASLLVALVALPLFRFLHHGSLCQAGHVVTPTSSQVPGPSGF